MNTFNSFNRMVSAESTTPCSKIQLFSGSRQKLVLDQCRRGVLKIQCRIRSSLSSNIMTKNTESNFTGFGVESAPPIIQEPFQEIESRLFDDTYTKEEVKELVADLEKIVACDVESELISFAHNNVLMLKQLFKQAEKWYLRLEIDMSELQNQEELEVIKFLESGETQPQLKSELENGESAREDCAALLKLEIERLKEENERLSKVIQDAEDVADLYKQEKNKLGEKLLSAQKEIGNYKALLENSSAPRNDSETIKQMEGKLNEIENLLSVNMENLEENENIKDKLRTELMSTKEKVKQIEAQLQLAEAELEKKFSETKAYANMKHILIQKNEKIKELREKISKYEPEVREDEDDEE